MSAPFSVSRAALPTRRWPLALILSAASLSLLIHSAVWLVSQLRIGLPVTADLTVSDVKMVSLLPAPPTPAASSGVPPVPPPRRAIARPSAVPLPSNPPAASATTAAAESASEIDPASVVPEAPPGISARELEIPPSGPLMGSLPLAQPTKIEYDLQARNRWQFGIDSSAELLWQHNWQDFSVTLRETTWGFMWRSRGRLSAAGLEPSRWEDRVGNRKSLRGVSYAHERQEILFSAGNKATSLPPGVQNLPSFLIQLGLLVQQNPALQTSGAAFVVPATTAKDLVQYAVQNKGVEGVQTPFGVVQMVAFTTLSGQRQNEEGMVVWLSPDHQYLPLQFKLFRDDGVILTGTARLLTILPPLRPNQEWASE
ncbi:DUF3108 domain-containing protein [Parvibium lacunae]|uniref:DUF3108 domain-containing protein n=1 Tax=Parvibium lacunae TaxID=1888893 RepID=A0A368L0R1_9BURK|nr:DUF3108 domain-containing protein [Parvibium lacunae]RCS57153.1 DUF3108 domain-containing protein [Parvibium lacunae]